MPVELVLSLFQDSVSLTNSFLLLFLHLNWPQDTIELKVFLINLPAPPPTNAHSYARKHTPTPTPTGSKQLDLKNSLQLILQRYPFNHPGIYTSTQRGLSYSTLWDRREKPSVPVWNPHSCLEHSESARLTRSYHQGEKRLSVLSHVLYILILMRK